MPKKPSSPLEKYASKRDFTKTPEPAAARRPSRRGERVFVVHWHEARRLHYDLRLEMEGVLKSFAIPKGFSFVPEDKHLAVHTEDHPLEYEHFDGVIPEGEYGAGTMTIWDRGTYTVTVGEGTERDGLEGLSNGKLEIRLSGARLRGEWHLVRTSRGERDWLIFKHRGDCFSRERGEPLFPLDLLEKPRRDLAKRPKAMEAALESEPFSDPDWIFELEFEGERLFLERSRDSVKLRRSGGRIFGDGEKHAWMADLARATRGLHAEHALLDGVLVALDDRGRPSRARLDTVLERGPSDALIYNAFDLLHYEEWRLDDFPLLDRKRALRSVVPRTRQLVAVDAIAERGDDLFRIVEENGLPGVIAKQAKSVYTSGESDEWCHIPAAKSATDTETDEHLLERLAPAEGERRIRTRVELTHLDKVYWPDEGYTKGDLLDYYDRMAEFVLPYLRHRPIHLLRYPEGIEGPSFYHKNITKQIPEWVHTARVKEKDGDEVRYVVCNDRDTLLYLVNLGSIDLHPWFSREDALDRPDWAIIDLDPSSDDFSVPVTIARALGKVLRGAGLRPLLKTSGSRGLHIYIPVIREYSYEQTQMFCELVARIVLRDHSDLATLERSTVKRGSKLYLDTLQNRRGQTVALPYVVRPKPGGTVSTPLDWDELDSDLDPKSFTLFTVPDRVAERGDLFRGAVEEPQELGPALAKLESRFR